MRDIDAARIVCLAPDVCLTPIGDTAVPIPYQIVDYAGHDSGYTESVRFTGKKAMTLASRTTHVHGDAPGTKKGVKSGTVEDVTEPIGHAAEVRAEGHPVIRHLDRFHMNSRNTVGEAIYVKDTAGYEPPVDDDPVPGSLFMVTVTPKQMQQPVQQQQQNAGATTGGQSIPSTRPVPQSVPRTLPGIGLRRRGLLGLLIGEIARDFSMSPEEHAAEARAFRTILSPAGQTIIREQALLGGRQQTKSFSDLANVLRPSTWQGKYGVFVGPEERIPLANDILSAAAGRPMDVRTATAAEIDGVLGGYSDLDRAEALSAEEYRRLMAALAAANVRISNDRLREGACLVGPYEQIRKICPGEAHHIVPDMALRYGNRAEGARGINRIPNAPTLKQGMTVCLTGGMHGGLHSGLNTALAGIGSAHKPTGTAPMLEILVASEQSIQAIPELPQSCKDRAKTAARTQFFPLRRQPGRTTLSLPTPGTPGAREVLVRGYY